MPPSISLHEAMICPVRRVVSKRGVGAELTAPRSEQREAKLRLRPIRKWYPALPTRAECSVLPLHSPIRPLFVPHHRRDDGMGRKDPTNAPRIEIASRGILFRVSQ